MSIPQDLCHGRDFFGETRYSFGETRDSLRPLYRTTFFPLSEWITAGIRDRSPISYDGEYYCCTQ